MADPELVPVDERPAVLAVAGLDPSGGGGLVQDALVIRAMGLHPLCVITGIAVQNTERFFRRHDLSVTLLREQLTAVTEEFLMGAVKTGMLATAGVVETLAAWLAERPRLPLVVDPVLRSTSGGELGGAGYREALVKHLLPRARVVTPNLEEAEVLSGQPITERDHVPSAARVLLGMGPEWVLLKGGHLPRGRAVDFLCGPGSEIWLDDERIGAGNIRGTGCGLASAIAAGLARGDTVPEAARTAKRFLTTAIESSYVAGKGRFPGEGSEPRSP
jgi:hydroxymethylpyrimidine/phosphomethylpyrimidine kinase